MDEVIFFIACGSHLWIGSIYAVTNFGQCNRWSHVMNIGKGVHKKNEYRKGDGFIHWKWSIPM